MPRLVLALQSLVVLFVALALPATASAHRLGLSTLELRVADRTVDVALLADLGHLDEAAGLDDPLKRGVGEISADELEAGRDALASYVSERLRLSTEGEPCPMALVELRHDAVRTAGLVWMRATCPRDLGPLDVDNRLFLEQPGQHRTVVMVSEDERRFRTQTDGDERTFRYEATPPASAVVEQSDPDVAAESAWVVARLYLGLGVEHILLGPDHVLFILTLLVVARRLRTLVALITGFTVAHSVTLGVAALGIWVPSGAIVEPIIALSIAVVAVENMLREAARRHRDLRADTGLGPGARARPAPSPNEAPPWWQRLDPEPRARLVLVLAFGLVHGFGFAGVLADLGLPADERVVALLAFNAGVELGQLAIVAATWPLLWWALHRRPGTWIRVAQTTSALTAAAGLFWLVQRLFFA